jgi:hypothetical protein
VVDLDQDTASDQEDASPEHHQDTKPAAETTAADARSVAASYQEQVHQHHEQDQKDQAELE